MEGGDQQAKPLTPVAPQILDLGASVSSDSTPQCDAQPQQAAVRESPLVQRSCPWPSPHEDEARPPVLPHTIGDNAFGLEFVCDDSEADVRDQDRGLQSAPLSAAEIHLMQQFTLGQLDAGEGAGCTLQQLSPGADAPTIGVPTGSQSGARTALLSLRAPAAAPLKARGAASRHGKQQVSPMRVARHAGHAKRKRARASVTRSTPVKRSASKSKRKASS